MFATSFIILKRQKQLKWPSIDDQNTEYSFGGLLLHHEKDWNTDVCYHRVGLRKPSASVPGDHKAPNLYDLILRNVRVDKPQRQKLGQGLLRTEGAESRQLGWYFTNEMSYN